LEAFNELIPLLRIEEVKSFITEIGQGIFSCSQTHAREFDRGHPVVLILTSNTQYFSPDTTTLYIHKNVAQL
jgi:hypothetical protein